ncbi:MAG TPA: peptidoglycan editing factor PgeF [Polyangiaceae bacterium]|nr:peptidoglycan editing factor PgeF [Polyangiaceae bacterium]
MLTAGTDFLQSALLSEAGFRHAFFTRSGGVSPGPYATLSFSVAAGDQSANVDANIARAAECLGVEQEKLLFLSQIHGTVVHTVDAAASRSATLQQEGDALMSASPSVACGVRSADCVPILFADTEGGWVAAAHAGWRGVAQGIAVVTLEALRARSPRPGRILAAIGPHIGLEAFEVGPDVAQTLEACCPEADAVDWTRWAKPHVALEKTIRAQLLGAGLQPQDIDSVGGCTVSDPGRFFSFRRDGAQSGRHLSAIVARDPSKIL